MHRLRRSFRDPLGNCQQQCFHVRGGRCFPLSFFWNTVLYSTFSVPSWEYHLWNETVFASLASRREEKAVLSVRGRWNMKWVKGFEEHRKVSAPPVALLCVIVILESGIILLYHSLTVIFYEGQTKHSKHFIWTPVLILLTQLFHMFIRDHFFCSCFNFL